MTSTVGRIVALIGIAASVPFLARGADGEGDAVVRAARDELPPLSQARAYGRARSSFLADTPRTPERTGPPTADVAGFEKHVKPTLNRVCASCHGPDLAEGRLRIDTLNPDLLTGPDVNGWLGVFGALGNGEMPPEDASEQLSDEDRAAVVAWLGREIQKASEARRDDGGHTSFRRMTRYEYEYALQDLLGLPYRFAKKLPPESTSEEGFENSSATLQMSAAHFDAYRTAGLAALRKATVLGQPPEPVTYVLSMPDLMAEAEENPKAKFFDRGDAGKPPRRQHLFDAETGRGVQASAVNWSRSPRAGNAEAPEPSSTVLVLGPNDSLKLNLGNHLPDTGTMRVRIRVGRTSRNPTEYASLRLIFGAHTSNNANFSETISERDLPITATADEPEFVRFDIPLSEIPRNPFRKNVRTFPRRDELLTIRTVSNARGGREPLAIHVDYIDITAPHYDQWPPASHEAIFVASEQRADEQRYGREVLTAFMERAWCRPVTPAEVTPFMELFDRYRADFDTFEEAMLEVLATVLASPEFLYLTERAPEARDGTISDREWAGRIAFFLWSSLPDRELLEVARSGRLSDPEVLAEQVERMLNDPRAERFSRHFVQQWLGLDGMRSVAHVDDADLKAAMEEEPIAFFREALSRDDSVMDFLHSDHVVVNERLAAHYGIPDVHGPHFRRVPVATDRHRGGLLTSAAVLVMNSDGKDSHPLKRGVWMLEHVLHDPPPPPPPNVPEVDLTDPNVLKLTLKERIADHRDKPACLSCHARIDPWGIAFENYDALGRHRTRIGNAPVDATSTLFNNQPLVGMNGLKRYLLANRQDQFARAVVHKMTGYALGRPLTFGDRAAVDDLTRRFRERDDRLRSLVHLIVASDLFRAKGNQP